MRVVVVGSGYVGLVTASCLADVGNDVVGVDIDAAKVTRLTRGEIPIHEPGLEALVARNMAQGRLRFTTRIDEALAFGGAGAEFCFLAVGTPPGEDGSADLRYVMQAARDVAAHATGDLILLSKSTVPVGTTHRVRAVVAEGLAARGIAMRPWGEAVGTTDTRGSTDAHKTAGERGGGSPSGFRVACVSNPEFLKEGAAVADFMRPDRVVVGVDAEDGGSEGPVAAKLRELYHPFCLSRDKTLVFDVLSSEMTKYAANAMLATKISFINEIAALCERMGADVALVRAGIAADQRIGHHFIYPGVGYGGSCFPKDVKALLATGRDRGLDMGILAAVEARNAEQRHWLVRQVVSRFGEDLRGRTFALWGLAFKPETDDIREAPAVTVIEELLARGAKVQAFDPVAAENARAALNDPSGVMFCAGMYDALKGADALLLVTEWRAFRSPDWARVKALLRYPVVFDGRNQYLREELARLGFFHLAVGRPAAGVWPVGEFS